MFSMTDTGVYSIVQYSILRKPSNMAQNRIGRFHYRSDVESPQPDLSLIIIYLEAYRGEALGSRVQARMTRRGYAAV